MPLSRRADVIIHHQALHQQTPKHVVKPGYLSRQFPGFLNKPPDLFCLVIRGLIFSAAFFRFDSVFGAASLLLRPWIE